MDNKNKIENKRKNVRLQAFWKVYRQNVSWGYLIDLSESGVRVWLNKDEKIGNDNFTIKIHPPKELNIDEIDFNVSRIWTNPDKSQRFNEIGCTFNGLTDDKKEQLNQLIIFFKKYNPTEDVVS